ncbi:MAG: hypothetical protein HYU66_12970 [Armatimonadetes bacterium]|nr:hypothetical protein [Armatimonadota bacterium]
MPDDLAAEFREHPLLRTGHWQPRCDLCRLAQTQPEAYDWLEGELISPTMTQEEIAAQLWLRWRVEADQPQISNHKCKHVDPMLAEWRKRFVTRRAVVTAAGDLSPADMATAEAQIAIMDLQEAREQAEDPEIKAKLAASIAALARVLLSGAIAPAKIEHAELQVKREAAEAELAEGNLADELVAFVTAHRPGLLPWLAAGQDPPAPPAPAGETDAA